MQVRKNTKIIGIILEEIDSDFSKELVRSVANSLPQNKNYRLVVLSGKYDNGKDAENIRVYKSVYNTVFRLGEVCDIDGLIIHLGSLSEKERGKVRAFERHLEKFRRIPKVFIASDLEENTNVNYDNESGIREAVECIVNVNGLSRLCMLGGRDDNKDARSRREIFERCLAESGVEFNENNFESSDMSSRCIKEASALLDRNPDVQAIFCVNDAVAAGLYAAMEERELVPGRDIMVFGFDNTRMSGELVPPLTSIGSDSVTLGHKALELLLEKMDGNEAASALVPTRLYGRESLPYQMYDYNTIEMLNIESAFVYRMFDDCFYRYRSEHISREQVDLRRLFYEFISRMLYTIKKRYMSVETFNELGRMIDIFFENNAMKYTDASKMLSCIKRLQVSMNNAQRSAAANVLINRLFLRMKDRAICAISEQMVKDNTAHLKERSMLREFLVSAMPNEEKAENIYRSFDRLGLKNAALYMFEKPAEYAADTRKSMPEHVMLRCVVRSGELYLPSGERQRTMLRDIFTRDDLSIKCRGYAAFPVFCGRIIYGLLVCELTDDIYDRGEFIAMQLGRSFGLCEISEKN